MRKKKSKRGGARPGAGAPVRLVGHVRLPTCSVPVEVMAAIRAEAEDGGTTVSAVIRRRLA